MQQLLDKWERLRTSEYLRPDEKLMLNHCISDLKRFMDHSGEANEMVGKRTAVEWYDNQLRKVFSNTTEASNFSHEKLLQQAKEMEKERTIGLAQQVLFDFLELEGNDRTHLAIKIWACDKLIEIYGGDK
jgi:hypothetical protein